LSNKAQDSKLLLLAFEYVILVLKSELVPAISLIPSNVGFFNNSLNWKQEFFLLNFFGAAGVKVEKSLKIASLEKANEQQHSYIYL
jgi:sensor histidine kinase YesM